MTHGVCRTSLTLALDSNAAIPLLAAGNPNCLATVGSAEEGANTNTSMS